MDYFNAENRAANAATIVRYGVLFVFVLVLLFGSLGTVGAGQRGIRTRFGAVTGGIVGEGLYFKIPLIETIVKMDVRTQKEEVESDAASKDLQTVKSKIALNYSVNPDSVATLYQTVGTDFKSRIIDPAIQESVKASTAKFTAEELITKREQVRDDIKASLTEHLQPTGIIVEAFSIINFDFSDSFNLAIEAKVTAEQNALAAKNKLSQVQYEALQAIEEARGKAEALRVESQAISANPAIIQLRAIEKWNGILPQVTGAATPFVNIK